MSNKLKYLIILLIISIIAIAIILIYLINSNNTTRNINDVYDTEQDVSTRSVITKVDSKYEFFDTKACIDNYIRVLSLMNKQQNNIYEIDNVNNSDTLEIYKEELYNMLDSEYIKLYNININNIDSKFSKYYANIKFMINNMYVIDLLDETPVYIVYGKIVYTDTNKTEDYGLIIKRDTSKLTFSIYPYDYLIDKKYTEEKIKDNKVEFSINNELKENETNQYEATSYSDEDLIRYYFNNYKDYLNYDLDSLYNKLGKEYREKRFGTIEKYKQYIKQNMEALQEANLIKYTIDNENNEYVCEDENGKIYIFEEQTIGVYTLTLDTYTLENEKFTTEYAKATNQSKVKMNIDKMFQMINSKDYTAAYNLLPEGFKNLNFNEQSKFENFIKNNLFEYNEISYDSFSDKISGVFIYKITLTDRTNKNDNQISMNIIMELLENTEFKVSFEIL